RTGDDGSHANVLPRERAGDTAAADRADIESDLCRSARRDGSRGATREVVDVIDALAGGAQGVNSHGRGRAARVKNEPAVRVQEDRPSPDIRVDDLIIHWSGQSRVGS